MFIIVNSILIWLGLLFDISLFKSFPGTSRFGYSGLFSKSGEAVLTYSLISLVYYVGYVRGKNGVIPILYFCIIALLTGKKTALLLIAFYYILHFCIKSKHRFIFRILGFSCLMVLFFVKEIVISGFLNWFPFWHQLYENNGIWSVVFSTRNDNFLSTVSFIKENWSLQNYIFGGINYNKLKIEIDPLDLFTFLGLLGSLAILNFYRIKFISLVKSRLIRQIVIGYIILGMIYGAFLSNIFLISSLYIAITYLNPFEDK